VEISNGDNDSGDVDNACNTGGVETKIDSMPSSALRMTTEDNVSMLDQSYRPTIEANNSNNGVPALPIGWTPS